MAAVPALAGTPEPDPAFAAIQRHWEAWDFYGEAINRLSIVQQQAIDAGMNWDDHPDMEAAEEGRDLACEANCDALDALVETAPATAAGAAAWASYIVTICERDDFHDPATVAVETLGKASRHSRRRRPDPLAATAPCNQARPPSWPGFLHVAPEVYAPAPRLP